MDEEKGLENGGGENFGVQICTARTSFTSSFHICQPIFLGPFEFLVVGDLLPFLKFSNRFFFYFFGADVNPACWDSEENKYAVNACYCLLQMDPRLRLPVKDCTASNSTGGSFHMMPPPVDDLNCPMSDMKIYSFTDGARVTAER